MTDMHISDRGARILCCGEALIDLTPIEGGFHAAPGGAALNSAVALGRLGARVGLVSGLSTDMFGRRLIKALDGAGVDHALSPRSARPTALAFVTYDAAGDARYQFRDQGSAGRMFAAGDAPAPPDSVRALLFGGVSLIAEPAASTYEAMAARGAGDALVMLDLNIRPALIHDPATYRARLRRMMARADIVKASEEDAEWLFPDTAAPLAPLAGLCGGALILTRGAEGATARLASGDEVSVPAPPARVFDTIGAGDSFNAGFLLRLDALGLASHAAFGRATPAQIADCMDMGARVASISVSRRGADPPWLSELPD